MPIVHYCLFEQYFKIFGCENRQRFTAKFKDRKKPFQVFWGERRITDANNYNFMCEKNKNPQKDLGNASPLEGSL